MIVFVKEYCRDVIVRIYGTDGEERTHEYFEKYLMDVDGVYETTAEERREYFSEAAFTIVKAAYYEFLAQHIENIQRGIDVMSAEIFEGRKESDYTFDSVCYAV